MQTDPFFLTVVYFTLWQANLCDLSFHKYQTLISFFLGNFLPFPFANVITCYQVADSMRVFSSLFFFPPQALLGFS